MHTWDYQLLKFPITVMFSPGFKAILSLNFFLQEILFLIDDNCFPIFRIHGVCFPRTWKIYNKINKDAQQFQIKTAIGICNQYLGK